MNLYLLSQSENSGYDTFDSMVVAAPDIDTARQIHPQEQWGSRDDYNPWDDRFPTWASDPENVDCQLIGTSISDTQEIIITSFNAG